MLREQHGVGKVLQDFSDENQAASDDRGHFIH